MLKQLAEEPVKELVEELVKELVKELVEEPGNAASTAQRGCAKLHSTARVVADLAT